MSNSVVHRRLNAFVIVLKLTVLPTAYVWYVAILSMHAYNHTVWYYFWLATLQELHLVTRSPLAAIYVLYLCISTYLDTMVYDYRFVNRVNTIKDITVLTSKALIHNCDKSKIRFQLLKMRSNFRKWIFVMISMYL